MLWGLACLLLLASCNSVYGLDKTALAPPPDRDGDMVPDSDDNCPDTPNPLQADQDGDGIGDVCDDCPLVSNPDQTTAINDYDGDHIGDECDPHPGTAGDCLIALESFSDPASLSRWSIVSTAAAPNVHLGTDSVVITVDPGAPRVALTAQDLGTTPLTGRFDPEVLVDAQPPFDAMNLGQIAAVSNYQPAPAGYSCAIARTEPTIYKTYASELGGVTSPPGTLSLEPVNTHMLVRLISDTGLDGPIVRCRVDFGGAVGASLVPESSATTLSGGAPGVVVTEGTVTIKAVAIYQFRLPPPNQPPVSCLPTLYY